MNYRTPRAVKTYVSTGLIELAWLKAASTSSRSRSPSLARIGIDIKSGLYLNQLVRCLNASCYSSSFVLEIPRDNKESKSYGSASWAALNAMIA